MAISKKGFADCFEKWKELWDKCVRFQEQYFEGDEGVIFLVGLLFYIKWPDAFRIEVVRTLFKIKA